MKRLVYGFSYVLLAVVVVLVLRAFFPKYEGFIRYFFFFLVFDAYLWFSVRKAIKAYRHKTRLLLSVIYWLPLAVLFSLIIYGNFKPFLDWDIGLRSYAQSLLLILFISKIFPLLALMVSDIIRISKFTYHLFHPEKVYLHYHSRFTKPMLKTGWIVGGILFLVLIGGMVFWQYSFQVTRHDIVVKGLPEVFNQFKIIQISDLHLGSWTRMKKLDEAVEIINKEQADLIFITGDLFNYSTADGNGFEQALSKMKAKEGIFTILGNHDYGDYLNWKDTLLKKQNMANLEIYFQHLGWMLLRNDHRIVRRGNDSIVVIGVENWGKNRRFQRLGDIDKAQQGVEAMKVKLLLSHDPTYWEFIISRSYQDIDLTFSGHTHGGQIGIHCCGIKWGIVQYTSKYWMGLYQSPNKHSPQFLYVNAGLGTIGYSGRIGIKPEISIFKLVKE